MKRINWIINCYLILLVTNGASVRAQLLISDTVALPPLSYKIAKNIDSISNASELSGFYKGLSELQTGKDTVLTIVHLGDSHIQAGYLPGRVMRLMHETFGNAGRGWISPLKLSKTNEPDDYFISSAVPEWIAGRCIQNQKKCPIGIGGMGIQSKTPSVNFDLIIAPNNGAGYAFNQVVLYRHEQSDSMKPVNKKIITEIPFAPDSIIANVIADTFRMDQLVDTLKLKSSGSKAEQNVYYGFNLSNGNSGILYHAIGINGAMFESYSDEQYISQLTLLKPDLLIVSLGTNETFGRHFKVAEFTGQIERFIALLRYYFPQTEILLTTPPECYKRAYVNKKRTYVRNANTILAAQAITDVAKKEDLAYWDLFSVTGGKGSYQKWHQQKLMGRDRVHFNKEGYYEQATLLYRALMQSYNKYKASENVR